MKDIESVQDSFSRLFTIINQIRSYGNTIIDKKNYKKKLRCLLGIFEHVVVGIEEFKDLNLYLMDHLFGSLKEHEKRIRKFST